MAQSSGLTPTTPPRAGAPDRAGDGTHPLLMYVDEGVRQVQFMVLWIRYRTGLTALRDQGEARPGALADRLMTEVIFPVHEVEWLPGLKEITDEYKRTPARFQNIDWDVWLGELRDRLNERIAASVRAGLALSSEGLRALVKACRPGQDSGTARLTDRGAPFALGPIEVANAWVAQAVAIDAWFRLAPALIEIEAGYRFDLRLTAQADKARELAKSLEAEKCRPAAQTAQQISDRIKQSVDMIQVSVGQRAGKISFLDRYFWHKAYAATPESWPPRVLANLAEQCRHEAAHALSDRGLFDRFQVPQPSAGVAGEPRRLLALGVLDALDARASVTPVVWSAAEQAIGTLLGGKATLVRGQPLDAKVEHAWRPETPDSKIASWSLEQTGLVLNGAEVVRPASVRVPRETESPLLAPLQALRAAKGGGTLAALAGELYNRLARAPRLELNQLSLPGDLILIWRTLARARMAGSGASAALVDELAQLGYSFVAAPRRRGAALAGDPGWAVVVPDASIDRAGTFAPPEDPSADAVALRLPDGRIVLPTAWLRVPHPWLGQGTCLDVLVNHEADLLRLTSRGPALDGAADWAVNSGLADLVRALVAARRPDGLTAPPPARTGAELGTALFLAFFDESRTVRQPPAPRRNEELHAIASALYQTLDAPARAALGIPLRPDLSIDFDALIASQSVRDLVLDWDDKPATGDRFEEVAVELRRGGSPARLRLRPPRRCGAAILGWVRLPDPATVAGGIFARHHRSLRWLPAHPNPAEWLTKITAELAALLSEDEVLNTLVHAVLAPDDGAPAARAWLAQAVAAKLVTVYPDLNPATLAPSWPASLAVRTTEDQGLFWTLDAAPFGSAVATAPFHYSTDPSRARGAFSLGPRERRKWLASAVDLADWARTAPDAPGGSFRAAADQLVTRFIDGLRSDPDSLPTPTSPLLAEALAALLQQAPTATAAGCDAALARLRAVADGLGQTIQPTVWSFAAPPSAAEAVASEVTIEPDETALRFQPGLPAAGRLVLRRFGLDGAPARAVVSCGPPPPHYNNLHEHLAEVHHEGAKGLVAMLDRWPASASAGRLELDAVNFYLEFWSVLGGEYRREYYDEFNRVEADLAALLEAAFGLLKFEPRTLEEMPEAWVEVTSQGSFPTGRVRRVRRPGLKTNRNELKVVAQLEVE